MRYHSGNISAAICYNKDSMFNFNWDSYDFFFEKTSQNVFFGVGCNADIVNNSLLPFQHNKLCNSLQYKSSKHLIAPKNCEFFHTTRHHADCYKLT